MVMHQPSQPSIADPVRKDIRYNTSHHLPLDPHPQPPMILSPTELSIQIIAYCTLQPLRPLTQQAS